MPLKHGLLGLLNYQNTTGYELNKSFKESLNFFWKAQTSQIYRELSKMENEGWLVSERIVQHKRPNKKVYSITDSGKKELDNWLNTNESLEWITLRSEFLLKLFFSDEKSKQENIDYVKQYKSKCQEAMLSLEATGAIIAKHSEALGDPEKAFYWEQTAIFGYMYYEMCLKWADTVIMKIKEK